MYYKGIWASRQINGTCLRNLVPNYPLSRFFAFPSPTNRVVWIGSGFGPQNWLPRQRPMRDRKTNFSSFIRSHSSANTANAAKIGLVDVEIIGLTESAEKKKQQQNISPPSDPALFVGESGGRQTIKGWLSSRVDSVLDSGTVGLRFKSQPRRCRVTVLGKLFTPIMPLFTKRNW